MRHKANRSVLTPRAFGTLAGRLLRHPAAPYHEHAVRDEAERICAENGLECRRDAFGNLLVRLVTSATRRSLVLSAHLDHPGFELVRPLGPRRWLARFRGGVPDVFFRRGTRLRLMPGAVPARLGLRRKNSQKEFEIHTNVGVSLTPTFAVWELPDCVFKGGDIIARSCDDLIGAAAILATLIELKRTRARVHVVGVLSRAEEVGFHGALALAAAGTLPKDSLVVSLETSRELAGVKMGRGVILRVGDRASIFDSDASRFLGEVAGGLVVDESFAFQRALMGGGTCEATAYQEFGYQSAAVCIALGNYHNCGPGNRIRPEYVSMADAIGMVRLLIAASRQMRRYRELVQRLPTRLHKLVREARRRLEKTA